MNGIRIGTVEALNEAQRLARVRFPDDELTSGWLSILKNPPRISPSGVEPNMTNTEDEHKHELNIVPWLPHVGDVVLCVYDTSFNGDGYVVGGL